MIMENTLVNSVDRETCTQMIFYDEIVSRNVTKDGKEIIKKVIKSLQSIIEE